MNEHKGHRQRLRRQFLEHGLDSLADHNVLELLLFYAVPRRDTNELAHRLMERFGGLDAVLDAPAEQLMEVDGLGEGGAALLRLVPELLRRYELAKSAPGTILSGTEAAGRFLLPYFIGKRDETVLLLCLDAKLKVLGCREIASGDVNSARISVRKVVETALAQNAPVVILAHNHTSGIALPSAEDEATTIRMRDALALVGIQLVDHIVVAGDDFVSLADNGVLKK